MTELDSSALTEALADSRMLEPEQFDEYVGAMLPICQDVRILSHELIYRGWLTPFQIEQILAGQAESLILGSYVLLEPLGEGGMGRVYRARNWKLNRIVAIKVIREEQTRQPAVVTRFQREIRALGRIHHPHIVQALDADFRPGAIFYAMEFVDGVDLGRYVRRNGPLAVADAINYIIQVADALHHAHELGLVHRDIKPSNLILTEDDQTVKLLDLGLTRCETPLDDSMFAELTRAGALIGTPDFMAPEQVKDSRTADVRSDLYSLGCTFYFLLAGRAPFEDVPAMVDKLYCQCESEPASIDALRPDVPPEIASVIHKLMAKRRRDRFQTAGELISALLGVPDDFCRPTRDTLLDPPSMTLTDRPLHDNPSPEMPATEILSQSEIGFVPAPEESDEQACTDPDRESAWSTPARIAIAVLIATLALVLVWQFGRGPGALRVRTDAPAAPIIEDQEAE